MNEKDNDLIFNRYLSISLWNMNDEIDRLEHDIILSILQSNGSLIGEACVDYVPKCGKVEVYSDHGFPHCHILVKDEQDIKVRLDNFEFLGNKEMSSQQTNAFNKFLEQGGKQKLISLWNKMNPNNQILN